MSRSVRVCAHQFFKRRTRRHRDIRVGRRHHRRSEDVHTPPLIAQQSLEPLLRLMIDHVAHGIQRWQPESAVTYNGGLHPNRRWVGDRTFLLEGPLSGVVDTMNVRTVATREARGNNFRLVPRLFAEIEGGGRTKACVLGLNPYLDAVDRQEAVRGMTREMGRRMGVGRRHYLP